MADAYFRVKHRPVATLTSTGPGSANLVMSLATALSDSSAFMAITSNVPTSQHNRAPFQELYKHNQADFAQVLRPVVKRAFQPTRVDMLPLALRQGLDTMVTGRPGPVNLDIPYNVFQEEADVELPARSHLDRPHRPGASDADVAAALDLLAAAHKPVLFIGHGATLSEAGPEITELAHRLGIPVITSPNGMGCIPGDDPLALGFIGRNGAYPANQAGRFADLVITLGTRFDDRSVVELARRATRGTSRRRKLVHVDIDPQELGRNYPPTLGIIADVKIFMRQLLNALPTRSRHRGRRATPPGATRCAAGRPSGKPSCARTSATRPARCGPEFVVGTLQKLLPDDVILALDSGVHHNWFMQFWQARRPQSMLNSWGYSSHGLRRLRRAGRAARGARPALRRGGRRRRLHDGALRAVHRGRIRAAGGLDRSGTTSPGARSATCSTACSTAARSAPRSTRARPASATTPTSPPGRAPAAPTACTVTRPQDLGAAVEQALKNRRPCVIDVHVDADVRPPSTGTWQLPPIPYKEPIFGKPYVA